MRVLGPAVALLLLAGCTYQADTHIDPVIGACGEPVVKKGPRLDPVAAWRGSREDVARTFAQALGRELGPYGPAPWELSDHSKTMWKLGDGYLVVADAPGSFYDKRIDLYDPEWPGADQETARAHVQEILARLGAPSDDVRLGESRYRRMEWTQPTPVGPMDAGRSERTTQWTRSYFTQHFQFPEMSVLAPQEAVNQAATFDACRTTHSVAATADAPGVVVTDGRLAYIIELSYGKGTPGGINYHGCPPPRTLVTLDAVTGAILAWDDTYICM